MAKLITTEPSPPKKNQKLTTTTTKAAFITRPIPTNVPEPTSNNVAATQINFPMTTKFFLTHPAPSTVAQPHQKELDNTTNPQLKKQFITPDPLLIFRFQHRHQVQIQSDGWERQKRKWIQILSNDPHLTINQFNTMTSHLLPSTKETYWGALLAAGRDVAWSLLHHPAICAQTKSLNRKAMLHIPTQSPPISLQEVQRLALSMTPHAAVALETCFALAARLGDILQLTARSISQVKSDLIGITFWEGKVVPIIGPYTLHVPTASGPGQALLALRKQAKSPQQRLFSPTVANELDRALKSNNYGRRSLRRGALQTMALAGAKSETLLHFSKHRTLEMLYKYLGWGQYLLPPNTALEQQKALLAPFSPASNTYTTTL